MARIGMTDLRDELRAMTNAGTMDFTAGTLTYFSDDQLDTIFDRNSTHFVYQEVERAAPAVIQNGQLVYTEYRIGYDHVEKSTGGTAIFILQNNSGGTVSASDYTIDYTRGIITFASDTLGVGYYATGWAYDINAAAADIYQMKANSVAGEFDFSTDNHSIKKSQVYDHYIKQIQYFRSLSKYSSGYGMMIREDTC